MLDLLSKIWLSNWSKYITGGTSNPGYPLLFRGDLPLIWVNRLRESFMECGDYSFWIPIFKVYRRSFLVALLLKLTFLLSCSFCSYIFGVVVSNKLGLFKSCALITFSYLLKSTLEAHNRLYISRLTIRIESGLTGLIFHRLLFSSELGRNRTENKNKHAGTEKEIPNRGHVKLEIQFTPRKCDDNSHAKDNSHLFNDEYKSNCIKDSENKNHIRIPPEYKKSLKYLLSDPDVFSMLVGDITSVQYFLNSIIDILLLPFSILLTWTLLKNQVGFAAALPGIVTFMLFMLLSFGLQVMGTIYKASFMENRDRRLSLCHDALHALRLIKIMGAEDLALKELSQNRKIETEYNRKRLIRTQFGSFLEYYTQKITQLIVFVLFYAFSDKSLSISSVLTSIYILHSFSSPLRGIPITFIEGLISLLRIKTFIYSHKGDLRFKYETPVDDKSTNCDLYYSNICVDESVITEPDAEAMRRGKKRPDMELNSRDKRSAENQIIIERTPCMEVRGNDLRRRDADGGTFMVGNGQCNQGPFDCESCIDPNFNAPSSADYAINCSNGTRGLPGDSVCTGGKCRVGAVSDIDTFDFIHHSKRIIFSYFGQKHNTDKGKCVIITGGSHGCGKTSVLNSMLFQKHKDVCFAYASRTSTWLPQGTVRSSILFEKEWDEDLYDRVTDLCQLKDDFDSWRDGDLRVIDEGGSSLSSGQKTRVSLARCLYHLNEASLFLFDDIFLNLDPNVSIKIFRNLFSENGFLSNSNTILTIDLTSLLYFINNSFRDGNLISTHIIHLNNKNVFFSGSINNYLSMINCIQDRELQNIDPNISSSSNLDRDCFVEGKGGLTSLFRDACNDLDRNYYGHKVDEKNIRQDPESDNISYNGNGCIQNHDLKERIENNSYNTTCSECYYDDEMDWGTTNMDRNMYMRYTNANSSSISIAHHYINRKKLGKKSYSLFHSFPLQNGRSENRKRHYSFNSGMGEEPIDVVKKNRTCTHDKRNMDGTEHTERTKLDLQRKEATEELKIIQQINNHISAINSKSLSIESLHSILCTTPKSNYTNLSMGFGTNNCAGEIVTSLSGGKTTFVKSSAAAHVESLSFDLITEAEIMWKKEKQGHPSGNEDLSACKQSMGKQNYCGVSNTSTATVTTFYREDNNNISFFSRFGLKYLFGYYYSTRFNALGAKRAKHTSMWGGVHGSKSAHVVLRPHTVALQDQPPHLPNPIQESYNVIGKQGCLKDWDIGENVEMVKDGVKIYMWYFGLIGRKWCLLLLLSCILKSVIDRYSDAYISDVDRRSSRGEGSGPYFIVVYTLLVLIKGLSGSFLFIGEAVFGVKASNIAHDQLLKMVFYSPHWFYDSMPVQYLMNRLSTDVLVMDELPLKKIASVIVPSIDYVIQIVMLTYIVPVSLPVTIMVIFITYKTVCVNYIATNTRAQRIALSVLSPMYGLFSQIINGIVVIYAFNSQNHLLNQFYSQIEHLQRIRLLQYISSQWAAIRLQLYTLPLVIFIALVPMKDDNWRYLALLYSLFISDTTSIITYKYASMERDMCSGERIYQLISRSFVEKVNGSCTNRDQCAGGDIESRDGNVVKKDTINSRTLRNKFGGKSKSGSTHHYHSVSNSNDDNDSCFQGFRSTKKEGISEGVTTDDPEQDKASNKVRTGLVIRDLEVGYYDAKGVVYNSIIKELNISVGPSEHIGVVGRTGSGKSTLVLALLGLIEYKKGQILLDDIPISSLSTFERRDLIGVLPQTPLVLRDWTVRDFLDPYSEFSDSDIWEGVRKCFLNTETTTGEQEYCNGGFASDEINLDSKANMLSDSQLRFYSIARLIINSKKYRMILIDEPPPSLNGDRGLQSNINLIINTHFRHCNVFIIAHHVDSIKYCNKVWILAKQGIANTIHPSLIPTQLDLAQILTDYEN